MLRHKKCGAGILAVLVVCTSAYAVKPEKNSPGYLTDGHGACGVLRKESPGLQGLLTVVDDFPEAEPYIESTIRWLYDVRIEMKGGYVWCMSITVPKGHQSYGLRPSVSVLLWSPYGQLAVLCLLAHQRKPNELCVIVADGAMDYGLSGMVRCLHLFATELDDNQSWDLSRHATCAMLSLAVKEEEGTKWSLFTRLQVGKLSR